MSDSEHLWNYRGLLDSFKNTNSECKPETMSNILNYLYDIVRTNREHFMIVIAILQSASQVTSGNNLNTINEIFAFIAKSDNP